MELRVLQCLELALVSSWPRSDCEQRLVQEPNKHQSIRVSSCSTIFLTPPPMALSKTPKSVKKDEQTQPDPETAAATAAMLLAAARDKARLKKARQQKNIELRAAVSFGPSNADLQALTILD